MTRQWYPGLMAKGKKNIKHYLKAVHLVVEVLEARAPYSSRNPELAKMLEGKKRVVVLNKADLADKEATHLWQTTLSQGSQDVLTSNSKSRAGLSALVRYLENSKKQVRTGDNLSLMVVGVPNVGKSTLINQLIGRKSAATGARPGITRGPQWIKVPHGWFMLDTPGLLPPKINNDSSIFCLAALGILKEDLLDAQTLVRRLINHLTDQGLGYFAWQEKYNLPQTPTSWDNIVMLVSKRRGFLEKGGRVDLERGATAILKDFREGNLGPLTLEYPDFLDSCGKDD